MEADEEEGQLDGKKVDVEYSSVLERCQDLWTTEAGALERVPARVPS